MTADGQLRHAAFKGLREDKDAGEVVREAANSKPGRNEAGRNADASASFDLTHPDRVLWPDVGLTKEGLAEFYAEIAGWILPHVVDRPLSLLRSPGGIDKQSFFQKHAWDGMGDAIRRHVVDSEEFLSITDLDGLVALVQAGATEIHPWGSTMKNVEQPDRMVFDLDPDDGLSWQAVVDCAIELRERLLARKLESFIKTSGGKGLPIVVPLVPKATWSEVKAFSKGVVEAMAKDSPDRYTASVAKRARAGRIFIDYLRNGRGATAIAPYSTRARAGAPVSVPLDWQELASGIRASHYTVQNLPARLKHLTPDPWATIAKLKQRLR